MENEQEVTAPQTQETENQDLITKKSNGFSKPLWINLFFLLCILVLFGLYFTTGFQQKKSSTIPEAIIHQSGNGLSIAYLNSDSLKTHYQLFKDLQQKLESKFAHLNADINSRQSSLESKAADLQKKFDNKQLSMDEAQRMDEMLKAEGKKLYDLNQQYSDNMAEEENRLNQIYVDSINNFLARFNNKYQFDYILGYTKGGGILYARDTLDITKYVIEGLNQEYITKYPESKKK